ncbi:hypothetical protein T4E_1311 [Trichinella pseudospiralis]|uniref:Uncharacterized protein n=1 Tax=Trichinella pseudospiralis TaxID=6337 RepID=A0A0V0XYG0_TRIPS|nr:hypothetical protein T4E_1311 [Trichinella pseudospiralis]
MKENRQRQDLKYRIAEFRANNDKTDLLNCTWQVVVELITQAEEKEEEKEEEDEVKSDYAIQQTEDHHFIPHLSPTKLNDRLAFCQLAFNKCK